MYYLELLSFSLFFLLIFCILERKFFVFSSMMLKLKKHGINNVFFLFILILVGSTCALLDIFKINTSISTAVFSLEISLIFMIASSNKKILKSNK